MVRTALDAEEPEHLRVEAILALRELGTPNEQTELRPLLANAGDDPDDEVKGAALSVLWPNHIRTDELFEFLTPPKRDSLFGMYASFLIRLFDGGVWPSDLIPALKWVAAQPPEHEMTTSFWRPVRKILANAWEHLDDPRILQALAETLVDRLRKYEHVLLPVDDDSRQTIPQSAERRRKVTSALIPIMARDEIDPYVLAFGHAPLVMIDDFPWLLDGLDNFEDDAEKETTCKLIECLFRPGSLSLLEQVHPYLSRHQMLAESLRPHIGPIEIDSPLAEAQRQRFAMDKKWEEMAKQQEKRKPDVLSRVRESLGRLDAGTSDEWWIMTNGMVGDGDPLEESCVQPDLTKLAIWGQLTETETRKIVLYAREYLVAGDPKPSEWLGLKIHYWPAIAGYKAMHLLYLLDKPHILALPTAIWQKWAPIIVGYPTDSFMGDNEIRRSLIALAYRHVPEETLDALRQVIAKENAEHGLMLIPVMFADCLDEKLESVLLEVIASDALSPRSIMTLLIMLLRRGSTRALEFARASMQMPDSPSERQREVGVLCASALVTVREDADWAHVWPAITSDPNMAHSLMADLADDDHRSGTAAKKLDEGQLAELYAWLLRQYPPEEDLRPDGAHQVTIREQIGWWRNSILQELASRSTSDSAERLVEIANAFPERKWLESYAKSSRDAVLAKTWTPVSPEQLKELVRDSRKRLVRSNHELMEVVLESVS